MIDTHCHIDDPVYAEEMEEVILRQKEAGVERILVPGVNVASCESVRRVCAAYPDYLLPALGLHPEDVKADWQEQLRRIREVVDTMPELVAIGEIGLDYHFSTEYKEEQQAALREQLDWAIERQLPVMIHARDAAQDTLNILKEAYEKSGGRLKGVLHCFSGSYEVAAEYVKMGWYLGIGGVLTFKNCRLGDTLMGEGGREAIPLDHLVLETDAPYMAPVPHRGKVNESRYMHYVAERLAELYKVSKNEVILTTNGAAKALFGLK